MTSFIPPQLLAALTRQRRVAPIVDVTLPDSHVDEDTYADAPAMTAQRVGSGLFSPMEAAPDRASRIIAELPVGNGDETGADPFLRAATRPRVTELPEDIGVNLRQSGELLQRTATPKSITAPDIDFRPAPDRTQIDIQEGLRSPEAARLRSAMELRRTAEADKPRGAWGKVGRVLKGIGEGAYEGLLRGGSLGAVIGGIGGGVSPKFADKLSDDREFQRRLPENVQGENIRFKNAELERRTQAELRQQQNFDRQARMTEAEIRNKETDNQYQRDRFSFDKEKETRLQKEQQADNQRQLDQQLFTRRRDLGKEGGERVTMEDLWTPRLDPRTGRNAGNMGQVVPVTQGEAYRLPSPAQEDARKLRQVTAESRARGAADLEKRIKMLPLELQEYASKERIKASFDTERDRIDLSGVPTIESFEKDKAEAKELATRSSNARKAGDTATADKLQAQADAAYGRAEAKHSTMMESGGYDDNSAGGWVGVRRKPMTRKGGVAGGTSPAPTSRAAASKSYIKTVKGKDGKMYGVTKVNPDGSVDAEIIQ